MFARPEYLLQPRQVWRRLFRKRGSGEYETVRLPWGVRLRIRPGESISRAIWTQGVYDLALTEVIWRLLDPGERAVDVGANFGYVTGLMAARGASVDSFEPHPELLRELRENVGGMARVRLHSVALGHVASTGYLHTPHYFDRNRGCASLRGESGGGIAVDVDTLDSLFAGNSIDLLKIDVEGHETAVLAGASGLLARRAVRDVVFEDFGAFPTRAMEILIETGYEVFHIGRRFLGPVLEEASSGFAWNAGAPNYLATISPARARGRLVPRGWRALRHRPSL